MARALKDQGVEYMFGITGFPVTPIAADAMKVGIKYYGGRNEQSASYRRASLLTGRPAHASRYVRCVNGLAGLANAKETCGS